MSNNSVFSHDTYKILAEGHYQNNNTFKTGLNNNTLIIGPTGSGKTRNYVKPNIMQMNESMVIADTKSSLFNEVGPLLEKHGYKILNLDFKDMKSNCRWNPLAYIHYDRKSKSYSENEIMKLSKILCPIENDDVFWDQSAAQYLSCIISYVLEFLPSYQHNLKYVSEVFNLMNSRDTDWFNLIQDVRETKPGCMTDRLYAAIEHNEVAERMDQSIKGVLAEHLYPVTLKPALSMYSHKNNFNFTDLAKEHIALFVNVSDTDRSLDSLISLFYSQLLQSLCQFADYHCPGNRLPIPVKLYLDDFACNIRIPDFDKIITTIRSREISTDVIIQSINQLDALYGDKKGSTIIDNCDDILYLGGQSLETAEYISERANIPVCDVLEMPLDEAYLFIRGQRPEKVHKFDITKHRLYSELPEASASAENDISDPFPDQDDLIDSHSVA